MPPRSLRTPPPSGAKSGFYPSNDASTYRELLRFEERLKTNAALLRRRKWRYQLSLLALAFVMIIATTDFVLDSALLISPLNITLRYIPTPYKYGLQSPLHPHPYIAPGTCLVAAMTLFLFYASGMYSEKIGFANQYVIHANHTLRSFNMHLNVRPKRSSLMSYIFPMLRSPPTSPPPPPSPSTPISRRSSQKEGQKDASMVPKRAAQITPIPPPSNPRGELIFSSRVDRSFRESYERYRAAYERKREEKLREASGGGYWSWFLMKKRRTSQAAGKDKDKDKDGEKTPGRGRATRTPTQSRSNTPHNSRRPSPTGSTASTGSHRRRSGIVDQFLESVPEKQPLRAELKPPSPVDMTDGEVSDPAIPTASQLRRRLDRGRTESFSFLLGRPNIVMPEDGA